MLVPNIKMSDIWDARFFPVGHKKIEGNKIARNDDAEYGFTINVSF